MSRVAVLLNCGSRSKRAARERGRLQELLASSPLEADLLCAEDGPDLADMARRAADDHYELLVAAGGDGTVNAVAAAVAGTGKALGVLPLGTINHFARHIGVPLDLAEAVSSLEGAETSLHDVGEVNGRVFVNNSTLGVYPRMVRFREHLRTTKGLHKWSAFAYAAARMIPGHDPAKLRFLIDGSRELSASTSFVFIGRSDGKLGSLDLLRGQKPPDGELSVCVIHARRGFSMVRLVSRALAGRLPGAEGIEIFNAQELVIEGDLRRRHIAMDGEVLALETPLHYRVRRSALRVAAPKRKGEAPSISEPLAAQEGG